MVLNRKLDNGKRLHNYEERKYDCCVADIFFLPISYKRWLYLQGYCVEINILTIGAKKRWFVGQLGSSYAENFTLYIWNTKVFDFFDFINTRKGS